MSFPKEKGSCPITQARILDYSCTTFSKTAVSPTMYYVIGSSHVDVNHEPRVYLFVLLIPDPDVLSTLLPFHGKEPFDSSLKETGGALHGAS